MKSLFFFLFLFFGCQLWAQTTAKANFKQKQIGINFSPDYSYRFLKSNYSSGGILHYIDSLRKYETPKIGYSCGLKFQYNFDEKIGIETGLQFSNKGYKTKERFVIQQKQPIDPLGWGDSILYDTMRLKTIRNLNYIDIPLKINVTLGKGRLRFIGGVGIVANVYLATATTVYLNEIKRKGSGYWGVYPGQRRVNLSAIVSSGIDYQINDNFSFRVEPTFQCNINSISQNAPLKEYLWSVGLNFGGYYGF